MVQFHLHPCKTIFQAMKNLISYQVSLLCWILVSSFSHAFATTGKVPSSPTPPSSSITTGRLEKASFVHVSDLFKVPNKSTSDTQREEWYQADTSLWNYVEASVPAVLDHTGTAAFDEHLKGVQAVLRYWESPPYVTSAGLFHSIYGTEGFQGFSLPLSERKAIQDLIGEKAESLCFHFCMIDRSTFDETVFAWDGPVDSAQMFHMKSRPELGRFDIVMNRDQWLDFMELTLADWLEQVEGAAMKPSDLFKWNTGEAYAYRRLAYRKMSEILSQERAPRLATVPMDMLTAVMATESPTTRHLVQPRTPPMSKATAHAYDALRAIGEPIPVDLSPQPMETFDVCQT